MTEQPGPDRVSGPVGYAQPHQEVAALYAATYRRLVGVVSLAARSPADAEECVQEAFVRLLDRWERIRGYDDPEAWVRAVAFSLAAGRYRTERRRLRILIRERVSPVPVPPRSDDALDIERALARLPLAHRQVVVLHHLVGLEVAEVARTLNVPEGTVKSRLARARAALGRSLVEGEGRG